MNKKEKIHSRNMKRISQKRENALMRMEEAKLRAEVFKIYFPFKFAIKFNKLIVFICIVAISLYTIASILLQRNYATEISPTLTTCVFAFFGTELLSLAGIKIVDTKFDIFKGNEETTTDEDSVG